MCKKHLLSPLSIAYFFSEEYCRFLFLPNMYCTLFFLFIWCYRIRWVPFFLTLGVKKKKKKFDPFDLAKKVVKKKARKWWLEEKGEESGEEKGEESVKKKAKKVWRKRRQKSENRFKLAVRLAVFQLVFLRALFSVQYIFLMSEGFNFFFFFFHPKRWST